MNTLFNIGAALFQSFGLIFVIWLAFVGVMSGPRTVERMFEKLFSALAKEVPKLLHSARKLLEELAKAIVHLLPARYQSGFLEAILQFALGLTALWLFVHC